jgi:hypothetical protein
MSDRKPCVNCGRTIDAFARLCPYCNWVQDEPVPPRPAVAAAAAPEYVPPRDQKWRKPVLMAGGGVLLVIACFVIGAHVHGNGPPPVPAKEVPSAPAPVSRRQSANVTLVPDNEPVAAFGLPITSAPAPTPQPGVANEYNRTDATAASSAEYAQMAARAAAEKKQPTITNPLMISGSAYGQPAPQEVPRPRTITEPRREALRTPPVPEYQPLPDIRVRRNVTAQIQLSIGTDGRVHEVNVLQPIPGETARLIGAIQTWRFRPATQNGVPVPSSFSTAISFHADE